MCVMELDVPLSAVLMGIEIVEILVSIFAKNVAGLVSHTAARG